MRAYAILDVFTNTPLEGNPVAVFSDGSGLSTAVMQQTARELNLSETVFLFPGRDGADAQARIFTPATELPFAGHPVLGTAFLLADRNGSDVVRLLCGAGVITVRLSREDGVLVDGEMEQPVPTWVLLPQADAVAVLAALGVTESALPVEVYDNGPRHAFVALADAGAVSRLRPDFRALGAVGAFGVSCFAVTGHGVKTRMFGPGLGVNEDPATGSAAGPLAVHLARHGISRFGEPIEISQGEEIGRPSRLRAMVQGTSERIDRVTVGGGAVLVARGEYRLD
ncbi:MAG TPA: PhzF family phenazine biosynthesis protein [Solirubrobacteraceae bacterium]